MIVVGRQGTAMPYLLAKKPRCKTASMRVRGLAAVHFQSAPCPRAKLAQKQVRPCPGIVGKLAAVIWFHIHILRSTLMPFVRHSALGA